MSTLPLILVERITPPIGEPFLFLLARQLSARFIIQLAPTGVTIPVPPVLMQGDLTPAGVTGWGAGLGVLIGVVAEVDTTSSGHLETLVPSPIRREFTSPCHTGPPQSESGRADAVPCGRG